MESKTKEDRKDKIMGTIVAKIVLTGGPCAGKTTALSKIEEELHDRGYRVFIVGESATELIKGGIRPFGENPLQMIDFQRLILKYQREKEFVYEQAIAMLPEEEKCVLLYDRGLLDNKAYITEEQFQAICKESGYQELDMLDSYDMVLHLVTAADGCPKYYTLENNQARSESVEEAIRLDQRTQQAWNGHNHFVLIDNSTDFKEKMNRVLEAIYQLVHEPYSIRYQKKYLVNLPSEPIETILPKGYTKVLIEQTYLEEAREHYERRLRKRTIGDESTYYLTVQKKAFHGMSKIVTDKKITEKEYYRLLEGNTKGTVKKERYTFLSHRQYFKLDFIEDKPFMLLEVNPTSCESKVVLPDGFQIEKEVTDDTSFDNATLAIKNKQYVL